MAEATLSGATHHILANDYASEWMGIEVLTLDDGHATIRMTLRQEMLNGFGMAHGGMIFAFGDTAFALACNPVNPAPGKENTITVASGVDINFLKPAFQGQVITAVANRRVQRRPQRPLRHPDLRRRRPAPPTRPRHRTPGELIAEFRGRSRTIPKK